MQGRFGADNDLAGNFKYINKCELNISVWRPHVNEKKR